MAALKSDQNDSGDDDSEFVDAQEEADVDSPQEKLDSPQRSQPSLDEGLAAAFDALGLFLSNKFEQAKDRGRSLSETSMYHSISYSTILGLQAMMTMDQGDIVKALEASKRTVNVVKQMRKKQSMLVWNRGKIDYTLDELHAELIYAESLLLYALITFLEDENLVSFVKAAFKIRRCYLAYQECHKLLERYQFTSTSGKAHFESGVRLGYGLFNVLISNLPPRIMSLLEFVGFSGDKEVGLREIELGVKIENGLRTPLCWLAMLSYNLVAVYAFGLSHSNLKESDAILKKALDKYPESVMFLFFRGKFEQVSGRFMSAIESYERAVSCQSQWQQFHHLCYWEEMATHALLADWLLAMKLAETLSLNSRWSKALYQYLKACFMLELISQYQRNTSDPTDPETIRAMQQHVAQLMEDIPNLRQKIAGKSVPIEKFAAAKALRYSKTGKIVMPGIEMIFVLNWTKIMSSDPASCERVLNIIDEELKLLGINPKTWSFKHDRKSSTVASDDLILAIFLRGTILRELNRCDEAKLWLKACNDNWSESHLGPEVTYVLPGSWIELANIAVSKRDIKLARQYLDEARSYKQYHHVSRMQFRIHALQSEITSMEGNAKHGKGALDTVTNNDHGSHHVSKSKTVPNNLSSSTTAN